MARLLFLVNDLSTMNPSQSTFGLICHASQVHEVWLAESAALTATMDGVVAIARPWQVGVSIDSVATLEPQHIPLLTCDGVRLGHQARQTSADGVTVPVGAAGGAGAARAGVTRVRPGALDLGAGVRNQALGALAEWPALLAMAKIIK